MPHHTIPVPHLETALIGPLLALEKHLLAKQLEVESWLRAQWQITRPPFYASVDLRNAGYKIAPVDTNLFPAGFNNLNPDFMPLCTQAVQATMAEICPNATRLLLIPENHTRNLMYLENVAQLQHILQQAGFDTRIGSVNPDIQANTPVDLPSGKSILLEPLQRQDDKVAVTDFSPCCIVINNDLSSGIPDILKNISQKILPAPQLGWAKRLKSEHFGFYHAVTQELCQQIDLDPWLITPLFDQCPEVDFSQAEGQTCLLTRAELLFSQIKKKYQQYDIKHPPFLVVKADQGTYGMAVMMIRSPEELKHLNRKQRNRMTTSKGGREVTKAIIQEGVYSFETMADNAVAEPVVYMFGRHVVGGFYRVHENKGNDENLNSPGMNFQPLAFANSCQNTSEEETVNRFYAYGVIARLAMLAAARELDSFKENKDA
jgi:glutamate--cysteine ligase